MGPQAPVSPSLCLKARFCLEMPFLPLFVGPGCAAHPHLREEAPSLPPTRRLQEHWESHGAPCPPDKGPAAKCPFATECWWHPSHHRSPVSGEWTTKRPPSSSLPFYNPS